jgi:Uma2 family endonuclease
MVATQPITVEEFANVPRDGLWELIDGEPVEVTPAAGRSSRIGGRLYARLADHVESSGFGWAYPADAGFILFEDRAVVRSPDAAFVRRDRLPEEPNGFIPLAPDFAAEVLSPIDRRDDTLAKVAMYLQAGVRLVWLIDPDRRLVEVFRPDEPVARFGEDDVLDGGEVIPGFSAPVAEIFS